MGVSNHILNGLLLQVSRIHATVWDRIATVWIVEHYFFCWRIQRVWTSSWRRHLQWKRVLLWHITSWTREIMSIHGMTLARSLHIFRFSGQHGSWWQRSDHPADWIHLFDSSNSSLDLSHSDYVVFVRRLHTHTPWRSWASNMGFEVPWCFAKRARLRHFARYFLRERDSWSLSGSPRLVFSAQLCRFGRVDVIWPQVFRGIPRVDCEVYGVDVLQSGWEVGWILVIMENIRNPFIHVP